MSIIPSNNTLKDTLLNYLLIHFVELIEDKNIKGSFKESFLKTIPIPLYITLNSNIGLGIGWQLMDTSATATSQPSLNIETKSDQGSTATLNNKTVLASKTRAIVLPPSSSSLSLNIEIANTPVDNITLSWLVYEMNKQITSGVLPYDVTNTEKDKVPQLRFSLITTEEVYLFYYFSGYSKVMNDGNNHDLTLNLIQPPRRRATGEGF